jgi:hypothetical protein
MAGVNYLHQIYALYVLILQLKYRKRYSKYKLFV